MRKSKRWTRGIVFVLSMAMLLSACGSSNTEAPADDSAQTETAAQGEAAATEAGGDETETTGEKVLVAGSTGYFYQETFDPAYSYDGWYWQFEGVLETMLQLDDSYTPQPVLIDSYEQVDAQTWTFTLKDGVKFHNGEAVTAESVKKCFEHTLEVSDRASEQIYFDSIEADGQVLTIKTTNENYTLLNDLCDPLWTIYDADNSDFETTLYGTGPYMIEKAELGVSIEMMKFADYWGGEPKLDRVICKCVDDADALQMALQNHEIDIAAPMPSSGIAVFQDAEGFVIDSATGARCVAMDYNLLRDQVADPEVRKAIGLCVDREGVANTIYAGLGTPSYGIFPESFSYGSLDGLTNDVDRYDVDAANAMLDAAGWVDSNGDGVRDKDGVELNLTMVADSTRKELADIGDVLKSTLLEAGINLDVQILENSGDRRAEGDFDIALITFNMAPTGNAQYYLNTRLITGASGNEGSYSNAEFDALAAELEKTADEDARNEIIKQATQILLTDRPVDVIMHQSFTCVYGERVKNFNTKPSEYYLIDAGIDVE